MSKFYASIIILLSIILFSCEEDNPGEPTDTSTQIISGSIIDSQDNPVANTVIEAYKLNTNSTKETAVALQEVEIIAIDTTDENGLFEMSEIPEDLTGVMLRTDNPDFQPFELKSANKENEGFKIKLQRREDCDIELSFEITDQKGEAIQNVKIQLKRDGKEVRNAKSNSEGKASIVEFCPDTYELRLFREGYKTVEEKLEINENKSFSYIMQGQDSQDSCCESSLNLTLTDEDGEPLEDVKVLLKKDGKAIEDPKSNGDGKIEIENLCEGNYKIVVSKDGFKDIEYEIEIGCNEEVKESKTLTKKEDDCCEGIANILVEDSEGNTLDSAYVIIKKAGKELETIKTNSDGKAKFDSLCEGNYAIVIEREGYERISWEVEIDCESEYVATKKLESKDEECCDSSVEFKISDKDGNAIKDAKVKIWKNGKVVKEAETNGDGNLKLEEWCEGNYGVDISHPDYSNIEFEFEIGCEQEKVIEKTLEGGDECCEGVLKIEAENGDGEPLEGVKVLLKKDGKAIENPRTNGDGRATIDGLCEGNYVLILTKEGYGTIEKEVEIDCEEATELKLTLESYEECCDSSVEFKIKDKDGNAIKDAKVKVWKNGKVVKEAETNGEGNLRLEEWCEGNYGVDISHPEYSNIEFEFEIGCEQEKVIEKTLEGGDECCEGVLKIEAENGNGEPLEGVKVLFKKDGKAIEDPRTNGDGKATIDGLCEGNYILILTKEGYGTIEKEVEIDCEEATELKLTLESNEECCDSSVEFKISDKDGNAIKDAKVKIWKNGKVVKEAETDSNGNLKLEEWCEGNYGVDISHPDYSNIEFEFEIGCEQEKVIEKTLEGDNECCDAILKSKLIDKDNEKAIEGATVKYILNGKVIAEGKTNADGHFTADGLCKGEYTIEIIKAGYEYGSWEWKIEKCDDFQETFRLKKD